MIPRILHRIWFGPPMPREFREYGEAWKRLMPEWEHRLWTEADLPPLRNQDLFDRAAEIAPNNVGQLRADVARYEILFAHGGVYMDCDYEPRKPLDPLLGDAPFAAWEEEGRWIANGTIGSPPGHPFLEALIEGLPRNVRLKAGLRPNAMSGPQYFTPIAIAHAIMVYPKAWFHPYLYNELHRRHERFPDAYAVHHWHNKRRKRR
jgi:mannosyltransferase OCH1-like enzyme